MLVNIATGIRRWLRIRDNIFIAFNDMEYKEPIELFHKDSKDTYWVKHHTTCFMISPDCIPYRTEAFCSVSDTYNKYFGEKLALKRAMEQARFSRVQRDLIWQEYFRYNPGAKTKQ